MGVIERARLARFRAGQLGPICVAVFDGQASLPAVEALARVREEIGAAHPRVLNVNIVKGAQISAPDRAVTEAAAAMQTRFESTSAGAYTIIEGRGLAAVVARTFLATMALVTSSQATEVFRTIEEAVHAIRARPDQLPEVVAMIDLAAQLDAFAHER